MAALERERDPTGAGRGAWWDDTVRCWRFALFSAHATGIELHLFRRDDPGRAVVSVTMQRRGDVWHAAVPDADRQGADLYGFRVAGPWQLPGVHRFDRSKILLDPHARQVWFPPGHDRGAARSTGRDTAGAAPLAVLSRAGRTSTPRSTQAVSRPVSPRPPLGSHERVVAEVHVRGATASPASPAPRGMRGTFAGLHAVLGHWAALGITVVELMPVHQSDPQEGSYWGYMPLAFGAVEGRYAAGDDPQAELAMFVEAAHRSGVHVWLDVVFNHTTEYDATGPTLSHRGVDRATYYVVDTAGIDHDDSGCGNVVRAAHPETTALVLAALDRFVDMGIDGFRFDLASLLARDPDGTTPGGAIPAITAWAAERDVAVVAEPWDLARNELGSAFAGRMWPQWNGRFRDDVRSFLRGEPGYVAALIQRVQGSPDLFGPEPWRSINFVTAHDGFTLYDLFAYDRKHNDANGWSGRDGSDDNRSWNCGWEGDDGAPAHVVDLRARQMRNAFCLLMLSAGVPMFVAGDEMAQTQGGNNNPYNQDNPTTWLDWTRLPSRVGLNRFLAELIALRRATPAIGTLQTWGDRVTFYGVNGPPDLGLHSRSLAWHLRGAADGCDDIYVMVNAWWEPLTFHVQHEARWCRAVDTSRPAPDDISPWIQRAPAGSTYTVGPRSVVVLTSPFRSPAS